MHPQSHCGAPDLPADRLPGIEAVTDPALIARGLFFRLRTARGWVPQVGTAIHIDGEANVPRRPPPRLGEDSDNVLRDWLGQGDSAKGGCAA
jgi:crotonobetainyl-CoA:carnitine CoA-transferase CaiB-like acyl-CoA transferase